MNVKILMLMYMQEWYGCTHALCASLQVCSNVRNAESLLGVFSEHASQEVLKVR